MIQPSGKEVFKGQSLHPPLDYHTLTDQSCNPFLSQKQVTLTDEDPQTLTSVYWGSHILTLISAYWGSHFDIDQCILGQSFCQIKTD